MTTAATSLLGLALPVTGELSGTWGDTVNNSITSLLDTAIAGTTTLSTDADVTLTTTTLASNQARQAILLCSGARTGIKTITAPAQSKIYTIINATTGGYAVKIVGVGPTTGISIPAGQTAQVAWNGSDFVDASNYTNGNKYINGNLTVTGTTTLSGGTANGVAYLNGSKAVTTGSALVFDGTALGVGGAPVNNRQITAKTAGQTDISIVAGSTNYAQLLFGYTGADNKGIISYYNVDNSMAFYTNASEQMRLTSTGLGIGTTSPQKKLVVSNGGAVGMEWSPTDYTGNMRQLVYNRSTSAYVALRTEASQHEWYIGGSESMRLDASGNLGLGVTPSAWSSMTALQVKQAALVGYFNQNKLMANSYFNGSAYTYIASDYASELRQDGGKFIFLTAPSGTAGNAITFTQAMTLDASGNLGIGTTSPAAKLMVIGTGGASLYIDSSAGGNNIYDATNHIWRSNSGGSERARIDSSGNLGVGTTSPSYRLTVQDTGNSYIVLQSGTAGYANLRFIVTSAAGIVGTEGAFPLVFRTSDTERARIDSSGNQQIGCTSTGSYLTRMTLSYDSGTTKWSVGPWSTASGSFVVAANASQGVYLPSTTSTSWASASDERLKENLEPIENGLEKVCSLRSVTGNFISDETKERKAFLIAQDVQAVLPEAVSPIPSGDYLGVTYTDVIPLLVAAIKEQQAIIEQLKADVAALKGA